MMLKTLSTGDLLHVYQKSLVLNFCGQRKVLSTSYLNGGYREDLTAVFNQDCKKGAGIGCTLRAPTYAEHQALVAKELGLDPAVTAGLGTAASMQNVAIAEETFAGLCVTAIITGGIEVNGGRVGDPAEHVDWLTGKTDTKQGTINTILVIDADLPAHALTRALITATEAKTAAIQELMAGSNYSTGLATGSGTDGTIIVSNAESPLATQSAGKHAKLGELIGLVVKRATKEALYRQTGLGPVQQHSVFARLKRYGINPETVWQAYCTAGGQKSKGDYWVLAEKMEQDAFLLLPVIQLVHLLDEWNWGLLPNEEVLPAGKKILQEIATILEVKLEKQQTEGTLESILLQGLNHLLAESIEKER